jgi:hypothetical protein
MSRTLAINACRTCGATNYRRVVARDTFGHLRPTGLYQCSGCSVVFADPKAWRDGGSRSSGSGSASEQFHRIGSAAPERFGIA